MPASQDAIIAAEMPGQRRAAEKETAGRFLSVTARCGLPLTVSHSTLGSAEQLAIPLGIRFMMHAMSRAPTTREAMTEAMQAQNERAAREAEIKTACGAGDHQHAVTILL